MDKNTETFTIKRYKKNLWLIDIINKLIYFAYLILIISFFWALFHNSISFYGFLGVLFITIEISLLYLWVRTWEKENDELAMKNWYKWGLGAIAEEMVKMELESLSKNYRIIPDFCKKIGGNIDFIIICEKGIFAIEVKANGGLIKNVNSKLYAFDNVLSGSDAIHQTVGNATYLSDLLEKKFGKRYFVQGVLEFPRGQIDKRSIRGKIEHIWIGGIDFYKYAIRKSQLILTDQEIEQIFNYLNLENSKRNSVI